MENKRQFSTILWDVDDTLLDFDYSMRASLTGCFHSLGLSCGEEVLARYRRINTAWWKRLEKGETTKEQLLPGRFAELFGELGITGVDVESFRTEYQEALGNIYAYLDASIQICRALNKDYRQYAVTNGVASTQRRKLELSGFSQVLDGLFISGEIGAEKPSRKFFDACLSRIEETDKGRVLIVGDSLSSDIRGGCNAGIRTCWYRPAGHGGALADSGFRPPDYEIGNLREIFGILREPVPASLEHV